MKNRSQRRYFASVARKSRGPDWEGIIRSCVALVLLLVGIGGLQGGASGIILVLVPVMGLMLAVGAAGILVYLGLHFLKPGNNRKETHRVILPDGLPKGGSHPDIGAALDALDWFQFEQLVARLFETKGSTVTPRGGANADGGIDLVVEWRASRAAVQCKHWSKWKCGPAVVRELIGSMTHEGFTQGFLVCGSPTSEARTLAKQHRIQVIDREGLIERMGTALAQEHPAIYEALFSPEKLCPKCGGRMLLKTARKGRNPGSQFWGCAAYPKCTETL